MYKIVKMPALDEMTKLQVLQLETECRETDKLNNDAYLCSDLKFDDNFCGFFMGYDDQMLTGFLTVFAPERAEGEIIAYTKPGYRREGRFTRLFKEAMEEIKAFGIGRVLIVSEPPCPARTGAFPNAELVRTEWRMEAKSLPIGEPMKGLELIEVSGENMADYARITGEGFEEISDNDSYLNSVLTQKDRFGYLAYYKGEPVGVYSLKTDEKQSFIYGLAVAKSKRRMGFGRQLVHHAIKKGLSAADVVVLDVDSDNAGAYELYKSCGFETRFAVEYHLI